jgi:hypothetical protein
MSPQDGFIPAHGGYRNLRSYQKAQIVFDATVFFCRRFLEKRDRTVDQMVQAARSGKQNIVEVSQASGTSKEMEIKLTNVARQPRGIRRGLSRFSKNARPPGMAAGAPLFSTPSRIEPDAKRYLPNLPER